MKKDLGLSEPPLVEWWAILPPPLDVVVGLRQVHFLSEYWRVKRGYPKKDDIIAEKLFPFISLSERFPGTPARNICICPVVQDTVRELCKRCNTRNCSWVVVVV